MAKVLLLEPDLLLASSVVSYLGSIGHKVQWHSTAQSAISGADEQAIDVVVLEPQLAVNNGIEFLYEFRSYPEWQNVPVIIFSSSQELDDQNASVILNQLEVSEYHHKQNTSLKQLGESVNRALKLSKV